MWRNKNWLLCWRWSPYRSKIWEVGRLRLGPHMGITTTAFITHNQPLSSQPIRRCTQSPMNCEHVQTTNVAQCNEKHGFSSRSLGFLQFTTNTWMMKNISSFPMFLGSLHWTLETHGCCEKQAANRALWVCGEKLETLQPLDSCYLWRMECFFCLALQWWTRCSCFGETKTVLSVFSLRFGAGGHICSWSLSSASFTARCGIYSSR